MKTPSGLQIDVEEHVVRGEPERRPHVCREEVPASARAPHCARKNVRHEVGRPGAGRLPWSLRTVPIVLAATRCPSVFTAP